MNNMEKEFHKPLGLVTVLETPSGRSKWKSRVQLRGIVEQKAMRKRLLFSLLASLFFAPAGRTQASPAVQNASGMRLVVADENSYPTLRVVLPGHPDSDKTIEVIFPEHVTVRHVGDTEGKHLFLFQPGQHGDRPAWRQVGRSLQAGRYNMKRISRAVSTC